MRGERFRSGAEEGIADFCASCQYDTRERGVDGVCFLEG